jgi:antitoxin (DNA-binding transcriptional repressor) of toxin-antitoxin stability system
MCTLKKRGPVKASILDLRRRMGDVLKALQRNEEVTLLRRGKTIAVICPAGGPPGTKRVAAHPAFGMWAGRSDLADVSAAVGRLRRGRFDDL